MGKTGNAQSSFPNSATPPAQRNSDLTKAAAVAKCTLRNPAILGRQHVPNNVKVTYNTTPPTSGNHNPVPLTDGYYAQEPNVRNAVHSLEHGRIEIHYKPTLSQQRIRELGGLFNDDPYHMLLMPDHTISDQLAVTAWGHIASCKRVTDATYDVVRAFRDAYRDRGPEVVP